MAQVTRTVAQGILDGQGYTDNEVRQLAYHFLAAQQPAPPADVPMLSDEELKDAIRHLYKDETALQMSMNITLHEYRAIERASLRKNGVIT